MGVYRGTVLSHDLRLGFGNRQLGISTLTPDLDCFIWPVVGGCLCIQLIRGFALYIITPSSLKKRDNSVGNVGNVGKSEKSPENFPRKVFQNAYIAYTTYIGWGLEVDYWMDTVPLHSARSAVLVDVPINAWLKQYNHIRPHQALNMRPPVPETLLKNGT